MNTVFTLFSVGLIITAFVLVYKSFRYYKKIDRQRKDYLKDRVRDKEDYEKLTKALEKQLAEYKSKFPEGDKA